MSLLIISPAVASGCSDNTKDNPGVHEVESKNIDVTADNVKSWTNYKVQVS